MKYITYTLHFSGNTDQMIAKRCKWYQCACYTQRQTIILVFLTVTASFENIVLPEAKAHCPLCVSTARWISVFASPWWSKAHHSMEKIHTLVSDPVMSMEPCLSCVLSMLSKKTSSTLIFLPNSKHHCFPMITVINTQRGVLKSAESQKVLSDTWGFSCCIPVPHVTPSLDCNPSQGPGIICLVVWYTRHDSDWNSIIKERLNSCTLCWSTRSSLHKQTVLDYKQHLTV